jgi:hypothetical protein
LTDYRSPVRLAIELNRGPEGRVLSQSNGGEFADCKFSNVRLAESNIFPQLNALGEYLEMWLIVERMGGAGEVPAEEGFEITVTTDGVVEERVEFGKWRVWDG